MTGRCRSSTPPGGTMAPMNARWAGQEGVSQRVGKGEWVMEIKVGEWVPIDGMPANIRGVSLNRWNNNGYLIRWINCGVRKGEWVMKIKMGEWVPIDGMQAKIRAVWLSKWNNSEYLIKKENKLWMSNEKKKMGKWVPVESQLIKGKCVSREEITVNI